jgi:hypothetical protein
MQNAFKIQINRRNDMSKMVDQGIIGPSPTGTQRRQGTVWKPLKTEVKATKISING